jgi:hypothetical protein
MQEPPELLELPERLARQEPRAQPGQVLLDQQVLRAQLGLMPIRRRPRISSTRLRVARCKLASRRPRGWWPLKPFTLELATPGRRSPRATTLSRVLFRPSLRGSPIRVTSETSERPPSVRALGSPPVASRAQQARLAQPVTQEPPGLQARRARLEMRVPLGRRVRLARQGLPDLREPLELRVLRVSPERLDPRDPRGRQGPREETLTQQPPQISLTRGPAEPSK